MLVLFQYVVSGSDEFNLYMWAIPEDLSERKYHTSVTVKDMVLSLYVSGACICISCI